MTHGCLNVKAKMVKILKENLVQYFYKPEVSKDFLDSTQKEKDKLHFIKFESIALRKTPLRK